MMLRNNEKVPSAVLSTSSKWYEIYVSQKKFVIRSVFL